ncbi:MAG: UDP-N-acetylmuramoyl-tripeptide--D-alanyl-D-alanine ligase [Gammaproteobacteria bacterium]|nr:UDP-N-acetylmuramoyl-tripeptide--D-alanyl-D-alanine ligase [Gammaproteobacteria bacterium]MDD9960257.1 UDP-N-acetylmuramoyl-tripeptide--D-alanyl-D-alanine ligase [Gammaproteobacteria bacterium]
MLSVLAEQLGGEQSGDDVEVTALSTDTRSLKKGDTYLALVGKNFNGNEFVEDAASRGANSAVVSDMKVATESTIPTIRVKDTHIALGKIASLMRQQSSARVLALTGSQGKTTVKEMIGAILRIEGETLITQANLNNTIGVPLTLLQLKQEHEFAVIEMGADCHGEIEFSATMTKPDIALLTNANAAHIEGFGSLQGIVQAKGEIIDPAPQDATIILNADDPNVESWITRAGERKVLLFSQASTDADAFATNIEIGAKGIVSFKLHTPAGQERITLKVLGKHNVINAVAAAIAAQCAGASLPAIKKGLESLAPVQRRLNPVAGIKECCVVDDSYNASPNSFMAAIDVLMSFPEEKILVVGDMRELGTEAEEAHLQVGQYAASAGVHELWAVGELSKFTAQGFGSSARHFESKEELIATCKAAASSNTVFLVKGSRGAHMEEVVEELSVIGGD